MSTPGTCARWLAAAVALSALADRARAEPIETDAADPARAQAIELPVSFPRVGQAIELVARDARALWGESPVASYARARAAQNRALSPTQRAELAVFRKTQRGAFDPLIADAAERWGVGPFLLKGLLYTESRLDAELVGKRIYRRVRGKRRAVGGGARGIAQFTTAGVAALNEARQKRYRNGERVAPLRAGQVWDPEVAIPAAAELLRHYIDRFGRDGGITAYNSGPYGGRLVARHGFYEARRRGQLSRIRDTALQGHKFLLNVLRHANRYRRRVGLRPLPKPGKLEFEQVRERRRSRS